MSIKPVDLQVMLPRTAEISKIHNDEQQRNQAMHQQQANTMKDTTEHRLKQVHSQDKAQEARIKDKEEKEKREKKDEKKRSRGNYGKSKETEADPRTSTIDIKL